MTDDDEFAQIEAARRDPRAFAPLYERYADLVWRYALRRLGDDDRAAEVTSATFTRVLAALPQFQPQRRGGATTFRSWLMTIARNAVIDAVRREHPTVPVDAPHLASWLVDPQPTPEEHMLASEEQRRVQAALGHLSATQRQIVELRLLGLHTTEIADMLGMRHGAIYTAHFRAYAHLRDLLAVDAPEGSQ